MDAYLNTTYTAINARSVPTVQSDLFDAQNYCRAAWAMGSWEPTPSTRLLYAMLESLRSAGLLYTPDPADDEGQLHFTLFQTHTFPAPLPPDVSIVDAESKAIRTCVGRFPHFTIHFKGVCKTRFGLFLKGYPTQDVNRLRATIRYVLPDTVEPHPQDICHATLFRFKTDPTPAQHALLDTIVDLFDHTLLYTFAPRTWEYGLGTWRMTDRVPAVSWPAHPRWILHRGLRNGPDAALENNEGELRSAIEEGWDVEFDVWYKDGDWYLGHDRPGAHPLRDRELLHSPRAWIHCKNLEAVVAFQSMPAPHYFVHDKDDATLTSQNWIWCYPGHSAGQNSVYVLPERTGADMGALRNMNVGAVCSDYLPEHFVS